MSMKDRVREEARRYKTREEIQRDFDRKVRDLAENFGIQVRDLHRDRNIMLEEFDKLHEGEAAEVA